MSSAGLLCYSIQFYNHQTQITHICIKSEAETGGVLQWREKTDNRELRGRVLMQELKQLVETEKVLREEASRLNFSVHYLHI